MKNKEFENQLNRLPPFLIVALLLLIVSWSGDVRAKEVSGLPNDPLLGQQTQLKDGSQSGTNWLGFWEYLQEHPELSASASDVVVAVLDKGIHLAAPDIDQSRIHLNYPEISDGCDLNENGINFVGTDCSDIDDKSSDQHGTRVAAQLIANTNNGIGVAGSLPLPITVMPIRMVQENGQVGLGDLRESLEYLISQIEQGVPIKVVNISWLIFSSSDMSEYNQLLRRLAELDVSIVVAVGNHNLTRPGVLGWPASLEGEIPGLVTVGGIKSGKVDLNSSRPPTLVAPVKHVTISGVVGWPDFFGAYGTSFSAPQVAQALAVIRSLAPWLSAVEARQVLIDAVYPTPDCPPDDCGAGLVDFLVIAQLLAEQHRVHLPLVWN